MGPPLGDKAERARRDLIESFERSSGLRGVETETALRGDGPILIFKVAAPTERLFGIVTQIQRVLPADHPFAGRLDLVARPRLPVNRLQMAEAQLLRTMLSQSLTVDQHSFETDFFERYIQSVVGAEDQIVGPGNHIVFGRRGAGKSSLLAYAMHKRREAGEPYAWVNLQTYSGHRDATQTALSVLREIFDQLAHPGNDAAAELVGELAKLAPVNDHEMDRLIPALRRALARIAEPSGSVVLFLDDLHTIAHDVQPLLLDRIYSVARGNRVAIKVSCIEHFTHAWDPGSRKGLEVPHDASVIHLDYNLTMPDKSYVQLKSILDAHARYCGLPKASVLCGEGVLERLVWVAAGVPRDALDIFSKAITAANVKGQKRVSITSVNTSISEATTAKEKFVSTDSGGSDGVREMLDVVQKFCLTKHKQNAFLVEIRAHHPTYKKIESLIALRMLHVLHDGFTPHKASRRYVALMLDYGFYVGIRAARSVGLFQKSPRALQAKELRRLPIFSLDQPDSSGGSVRAPRGGKRTRGVERSDTAG